MIQTSEMTRIYDRMVESNRFLHGLYEDYDEKAMSARNSIIRVMEAQGNGILTAAKALIATSVKLEHAVWLMSAAVYLINENNNYKNCRNYE